MSKVFKSLLKGCKKIDYAEVIKLGFERESATDSIWFNEVGYEFFIVHKKIGESLYFEWDVELRKVQMYTLDANDNILKRFPVKNLSTLIDLLEFFETSEINQPKILA